ncbi:unnamed protein product [Brugia timori]|uniref:Calpain catalytic domain-containing protein n=1 Tax=Brugia timori TaxID=42155 RepID=A0A0R3QQP9_9BILA|nr:unnamed protein product [Brugia timori]
MWIIVRNTKGEPPTCGCKHGDKPPPPRVMIDEWIDLWPLPDFVRGYDYDWKLFSLCALFGEKEWFSVHVDRKDIISPCVCKIDGEEILGK